MTTPVREIVILVHGTGASAATHIGERWWQDAGPLWQRLLALAEGEISLEAFIWSGANDERERRSAGARFAKRVLEARRNGQRVHLIGHSHGGSVIWHAVTKLGGRSEPVDQLVASIATVGTPFLHFGVRRSHVAIASIIGAASVAVLAFGLFSIRDTHWTYAWRDAPGLVALWGALAVIPTLAAIGSLAFLVEAAIRSLLASRAASGPGTAAGLRESYLCLWSGVDEPIIGLAASGSISLAFKRRWDPLRRAANQLSNNILSRLLQGSTIRTLEMRAANPWPDPAFRQRSLPSLADADLVARADEHSAELGRRVRALLASGRDPVRGFVDLQRAAAEAVTFRELVHTTYFDNQTCVDLLLYHVERHLSTRSSAKAIIPADLVQWYETRHANADAQPRAAAVLPSNRMSAVVGVAGTVAVVILGLAAWVQLPLVDKTFAPTRSGYWIPALANGQQLTTALSRLGGGPIITSSSVESERYLDYLSSSEFRPETEPLRNYITAFARAHALPVLGQAVRQLPTQRYRDLFYVRGLEIVVEVADAGDVDQLFSIPGFLFDTTPSTNAGIPAELRQAALDSLLYGLYKRGLLTEDRIRTLASLCSGDSRCVDLMRVDLAFTYAASGHEDVAQGMLPLPPYAEAAFDPTMASALGGLSTAAFPQLRDLGVNPQRVLVKALRKGDRNAASHAIEWAILNDEWDYALVVVGEADARSVNWDKLGPTLLVAATKLDKPSPLANRILTLVERGRSYLQIPVDSLPTLSHLVPLQVDDNIVRPISEREFARLEQRLTKNARCATAPGENATTVAASNGCQKSPNSRREAQLAKWRDSVRRADEWDGAHGILKLVGKRPKRRPDEGPEDELADRLAEMLVRTTCQGKTILSDSEEWRDFALALQALGTPTKPPPGVEMMLKSLQEGSFHCTGEEDASDPPWLGNYINAALPLAQWLQQAFPDVALDLAIDALARYNASRIRVTDVNSDVPVYLASYLLDWWMPWPVLLATESDQESMALLRREAFLQIALCRHGRSESEALALAQRAFNTEPTGRALVRGSELQRLATLESLWYATQSDWRRVATGCSACEFDDFARFTNWVLPMLVRGQPPASAPDGVDCTNSLAADVRRYLPPLSAVPVAAR